MKTHSLLLLMLTAVFAANASADGPVIQTDPVLRTADSVWVGESQLIRYKNRIHVIARTTDLDPGSAVTGWWRVYNRPQHCAVPYACEFSDLQNPKVDGSQLHATALVAADAEGKATIVATLYRTAAKAEGGERFADTLPEGHLNGSGLRRPLRAEVELLLANHGKLADPDTVGNEAAIAQLLTPFDTQIECFDPDLPSPGRSYRCGVIQKVSHGALD